MGTEGRKRLSLIQMILLTHLKAGFGTGLEVNSVLPVALLYSKPSGLNVFRITLNRATSVTAISVHSDSVF